jgi:hypothetical protein
MKRSSINNYGFGFAALTLALFASIPSARAQESATVSITIQNNRFQPVEPHAPANKPITIIVKNLNSAPSEFESNMLRVEKVVAPGGTISLQIRPLAPGRYRFFDDFHQETQGYLVVQ